MSTNISDGLKRHLSCIRLFDLEKTKDHSTLTQNIGTPLYLSPEQERGEPYDERVDIYSLGLIIFELYCIFSTHHEKHKRFIDLKRSGAIPQLMEREYPLICELITMLTNPKLNERPFINEIREKEIYKKILKFYDIF